ncbi:MAG TPA: hypothetical protein VFX78_08050, partial [Candidatus Eisenbacteria bacterium]|nr:hypothetical protein [Candidatus Eisenbacteria bacterium]
RAFRLHPTLGMAATKLVSRVAAGVLAPDGELLDVPRGGEVAFLAPLAVRLLPSARERAVAARLDLLNARAIGDIQAIAIEPLRAAFGAAAAVALWREARGLDAAPRRALPLPVAAAEETLAEETNDLRVLGARMARLVLELAGGLRARRAEAASLAVEVGYGDGREGRASASLESGGATGDAARVAHLQRTALALLARAAARRVRVRRIRIEARERPPVGRQLDLWVEARDHPTRRDQLDEALLALRARLGSAAVIPAAWMAHGLVRPSPRP